MNSHWQQLLEHESDSVHENGKPHAHDRARRELPWHHASLLRATLINCLPPVFGMTDEASQSPGVLDLVVKVMYVLSQHLEDSQRRKNALKQSGNDPQAPSWTTRLLGVAAGVAEHPLEQPGIAVMAPMVHQRLREVVDETSPKNRLRPEGQWSWKPGTPPTHRHALCTMHGSWLTASIAALADAACSEAKHQSIEFQLNGVTVRESSTQVDDYDSFHLGRTSPVGCTRLGLGYRLGTHAMLNGVEIIVELKAKLGFKGPSAPAKQLWLDWYDALEHLTHRLVPAWCRVKLHLMDLQGGRELSVLGREGFPLGKGFVLGATK